MKTLNKTEIDAVVGGISALALPVGAFIARPIAPKPLPADEPVIIDGKPVFVSR